MFKLSACHLTSRRFVCLLAVLIGKSEAEEFVLHGGRRAMCILHGYYLYGGHPYEGAGMVPSGIGDGFDRTDIRIITWW